MSNWDTPGGRLYMHTMCKMGTARLLPPEASAYLGKWITELLANQKPPRANLPRPKRRS